MRLPFRWLPLWGALLLTAIALLASSNAESPHWLRLLLWIGLSLYNALWWFLQVPTYPTLPKEGVPPAEQRELARLRRSLFTSRIFNALLLAGMSGIMLLVVSAGPAGAGAQSLGVYAGILLIALVLGVFSEWRRYRASQRRS